MLFSFARFAHRHADSCALLLHLSQLRAVSRKLNCEVVFERLVRANVQTAFGENRAETVFDFTMKLLVMLNLCAQACELFCQLRLTRDKPSRLSRSSGRLLKGGHLFVMRGDFTPQALYFSRGLLALVGEMLVARR